MALRQIGLSKAWHRQRAGLLEHPRRGGDHGTALVAVADLAVEARGQLVGLGLQGRQALLSGSICTRATSAVRRSARDSVASACGAASAAS